MTKIAASDRQKVASLYMSGLTQAAVAAEFGVTDERVCQILKGLGITKRVGGNRSTCVVRFAPTMKVEKCFANYKRTVAADQHNALVEMYKAGSTLAEVGTKFGITRERVRQIVKAHGVSRLDGGSTIRLFKNTSAKVVAVRAKNDRKEERIRATWGMSLDDYRAHVAEYGSSVITSSPMHKYVVQRKSAQIRGIAWQFTFAEWWRAWQESGKWAERGRGGYVMARYGDGDTPYSPSTIYICTQSENSKDSYIVSPASVRFANNPKRLAGTGRGWTICKRNKSNPYIAQFAGKRLGSFPTPELARAAYLAAVERSKPADGA